MPDATNFLDTSSAIPLPGQRERDDSAFLREALAPSALSSTPERVAASVTEALLSREFVAGQRILETDLTSRYQVSRATAREALKVLEAQGVVQNIPYKGANVRLLELEEVSELMSVLSVLLGLAARLAALHIDFGENRRLFEAAVEPLLSASTTKPLETMLRDRSVFYQVMLLIAGNEDLNRAMPTARTFLFRNQFYAFLGRDNMRAILSEYQKIRDAVLAGEAERAELQTRRHLKNTADRILPFMK